MGFLVGGRLGMSPAWCEIMGSCHRVASEGPLTPLNKQGLSKGVDVERLSQGWKRGQKDTVPTQHSLAGRCLHLHHPAPVLALLDAQLHPRAPGFPWQLPEHPCGCCRCCGELRGPAGTCVALPALCALGGAQQLWGGCMYIYTHIHTSIYYIGSWNGLGRKGP